MAFYGFRILARRMARAVKAEVNKKVTSPKLGGVRFGSFRYSPSGWMSVLFAAAMFAAIFLPKDCVLGQICGAIAAVVCMAGFFRDVMTKKGRKRWFFLSTMTLVLGVTFAVMCMIFLFGVDEPDKEMFAWFAPSSAVMLLFSLFGWRRYKRFRNEAEIRLWTLQQERRRKLSCRS